MEDRNIILIGIVVIVLFVVVVANKDMTGNVMANLGEQIIVPVKIHKVVDEKGVYTSSRDDQNILELFEGANRIWAHGGIYFQVEEIVTSEVSLEAIPNAINGNYLELFNHPNIDHDVINVFLVQSLNGLNGQALIYFNSILVSDFTSVNDYRTTAHELGHLFGLRHVSPSDRLMARGRNGEILSNEEIELSRENALKFSKNGL
jgi:hypothetical protein